MWVHTQSNPYVSSLIYLYNQLCLREALGTVAGTLHSKINRQFHPQSVIFSILIA